MVIKNADKVNLFIEKGYSIHGLWCGQCVTDGISIFVEKLIQSSSKIEGTPYGSNEKFHVENTSVNSFNSYPSTIITQNVISQTNSDIKTEMCPQCQKNISNEDSFCPFCGYELVTQNVKILATCPNCGYYDLDILEKVFCPRCKAQLPI